ncbi:hypothetical protein BJ912DRAFT_1020787 [Pholiota molesta]|nr:hypothetical protein BJ912DRAFT_1020787 [Pholiota molesta]
MKLSVTSIFISMMIVSGGRCAPTSQPKLSANAASRQMSPSTGQAFGAAYFITNEPSGNVLIAADIASNGKLTLRRAFDVGGLGAHGLSASVGPDPLFAQGSVKASSAGNIVATVNPGSNTLAVFSINPNDATSLQMIGKPVGSGGEFPMSLTINKAGNTVCALNGGAVNGVGCFKVDPKQGLVPIANTVRSLGLNQTTPATGPAGSASHIIFSEDNSQLIASVKGVPHSPDSLPSSANAIAGQSATCWSSFSPKTGNFFLTDIGTSTITEVNVDANLKGTIVKQYPQTAGSATIDNDVATVNGNDFLYVLAPNATSIDVLALPAAGKATSIQKVDIAGPVRSAGITISANNLQGMTTFVRK